MADKERIELALVQFNAILGDKSANLDRAEALLRQAGGRAAIACLPELFHTGYNLDTLGDTLFDLAEPIPGGESTRRLAEMAQRYNLAIVAGLVEQVPHVTGLLYDSVVLIDRHGELAGHYRKSHLYPAEHRFFRAGDALPVFEVDGVRIGIAICFELAFPPIFSTLALQGAELILNPSAVPVGYGYLQELRSRARAQDNQLFVAAVNHVGPEGGVEYCGSSLVADPRGDVIASASDDAEALVIAELDLALIRDQRLQEPVLRGFRPALYRFSG